MRQQEDSTSENERVPVPTEAPLSAEALFDVGREAELAGDLDGALTAYAGAVEHDPGRADWHYRLGCVCRKLDRYAAAAGAFRRAVDLGGESGAYLNNLGTVLDALGERTQAMQMFHRAIAADAENAVACHNLGALYAEEGRTREAIRFFEAALELRPDADGYHNLGLVHFQNNDFDRAHDCFETCARQDSQHAVSRYFAALSLFRKGVYADAINRFRDALGLDNRLVRAQYYIGVSLHKTEHFDEALAALLRALDAFPDDGKLHYQLGLTYDAMVMPREAREHYRLARR